MRHSGIGALAFAVIWACAAVPSASAHMRDYLANQMYYTAKKGEFEVETYNDMNFRESDNSATYNSKHQVELGYGITNHLQVGLYEVYSWNRASDWERDAFKIEAKYRVSEAGRLPVDIAFYTEYKNPDGHREVHSDVLENKLILSKDFGLWNVTANLIAEKELNTHSDWEFEYTAGASYALTPRTRLGLEIKQGLGDSDEFDAGRDQPAYLIPGIYMNVLPNVRVLAGPAFGLTRASDDLQLKSIVEVEF